MQDRSDLAQIVAKYRRYNPVTNEFDVERTQLEYADLLGVSRVFVTQITNGDREPGVDLLRALSRLFPAAATEIAEALRSQPEAIAV
jgi:DNA-binding XRE family transcriptional regulator